MLSWAVTLLSTAIIAALMAFTVISGTAAGAAEGLFFVTMALFITVIVAKVLRGKPPTQ